jgi:hypothetical protein
MQGNKVACGIQQLVMYTQQAPQMTHSTRQLHQQQTLKAIDAPRTTTSAHLHCSHVFPHSSNPN